MSISDFDFCRICGEKTPPDKHYYTRHKIKTKNYFEKYWDKKDLLTNEPIEFKNKKQYILTDFKSRTNMKRWVAQEDSNIVKEHFKILLDRNAAMRNWVYYPTQVELVSVLCPGKKTLYSLYDIELEKIFDSIGLKERYSIKNLINIDHKTINSRIAIDTREQKPLKIKHEIQVQSLEYGDYALTDMGLSRLFIERKSLVDFISSFSSNFDRLMREFERAKKNDNHIIVLVEYPLIKALHFDKIPQLQQLTKGKMRSTPDYIFHNVRVALKEFNNIQFLFTKGREESADLVKLLLLNQNYFIMNDIQYLYDDKIIQRAFDKSLKNV